MPDMNVIIRQSNIGPKERSRRLAQAYELILSWPDPGERKTEPVAEDLDGETAAGSEGGTPAQTADAILILPPKDSAPSSKEKDESNIPERKV